MKNKYEEKIKNNSKINFWESKLGELGYKLTKPRKLILSVLSNNQNLCSADYVYLMVKKVNPSIGISTVYRTLELLTRAKLVCKINLGSMRSFYMLSRNCKKETAIYMICDKCGRIIYNNKCLNRAVVIRLREDADEHILKNCNLKINNYHLFFSGLCDKCV